MEGKQPPPDVKVGPEIMQNCTNIAHLDFRHWNDMDQKRFKMASKTWPGA